MSSQEDPRQQAEYLAQIVITAQKVLEEYVADKISLEQTIVALTDILDAPALAEWMIANGFISKQ